MRWVLLPALLLAACDARPADRPAPLPEREAPAASDASGNPQDCVQEFDSGRDYFPDKVEFRYAEQVAVEYFPHYKVVTLARPWKGSESGERYLLLLCGTPRPPDWDDAVVLEVPARTLITTSTTELPHVVGLGLVDRLVGHDELDWVNAPEIRRRIGTGEIAEVGSGPTLNVERVLEADPGLLLADSLGDPALDTLGKLREAGVAAALAPSFLETSALGRAEWIQYTALFFNRERRARELFGDVERRYLELSERVREAHAGSARARPTVFTSGPTGDAWWMPGGRSYLALLLADAGADYLWAEDPSTGSLALDLESVYERAVDADFWLQPGSWGSLAEIRAVDERLADLAAFREGRVFNYDRQLNDLGGNDYWETGTARPDRVLADFVKIFHPDLLPDHRLVYHRRLPP